MIPSLVSLVSRGTGWTRTLTDVPLDARMRPAVTPRGVTCRSPYWSILRVEASRNPPQSRSHRVVGWYGRGRRRVEFVTGTGHWYKGTRAQGRGRAGGGAVGVRPQPGRDARGPV